MISDAYFGLKISSVKCGENQLKLSQKRMTFGVQTACYWQFRLVSRVYIQWGLVTSTPSFHKYGPLEVRVSIILEFFRKGIEEKTALLICYFSFFWRNREFPAGQ